MRTSSRLKLTTNISLLLIIIVGFALFGSNRLATHAAGASITLSVTSGPPTSSVRVNGKGFKSGETITLTFDTTQVGKKTASSTGTFSTTIIVPGGAVPGNHVVRAKGNISGRSAQTIFQVRTDWVQFGFNRQHTYFNVFENVLNPANVSKLTQDWNTSAVTLYTSAAIVNNIVYVGSSDGNAYALNATTGSILWSQKIGSDSASSPAVINNVVYVGTDNGTFDALNATSGAILWSASLGSSLLNSPTVANNIIYIGSQNGKVYTLKAITGTKLWNSSIGDASCGISSTTFNNGVVYISASDSYCNLTLYALNATSGGKLWSFPLQQVYYYVYPTATIVNGIVYIGSGLDFGNGECAEGNVYALNATSGKLLWKTSTSGCDATTAVTNNTVYVGSDDGTVSALNAITGKIVWTSTIGDIGNPIYVAPTVANGVVYVSDGDLFALNAANGAILWAHSFNNRNYSSPVVVNGIVYFASQDGNMYAFHLPA